MTRRPLLDEEGSALPLILVYAFLGFVLVLIVAAATSLYVERKRLFTLADATSLAAAETVEFAAASPGAPQRLDDEAVLASAGAYLAANRTGRFESLALDDAGTRDGTSATVTLSAYWRPPILGPLLPEGIRIEVTSSARSRFW